MSFELERRFIIRPDGSPLRTKIVATIGNAKTYKNGLVHRDGGEIDADEITPQNLVRFFFDYGVDVIRLNLSHVESPDEVAGVFAPIKQAILACEDDNGGAKRIAVLADLPGPKIRFQIEDDLVLKAGDRLAVVFDHEVSSTSEQTVYLDGRPLEKAMDDIDGIRDKIGYHLGESSLEGRSRTREERKRELKVSENILGYPMESQQSRPRIFQGVMKQISRRLGGGEQILVFIGEAEAVLEVDADEFDPGRPVLPCRVVTARGKPIRGRKGFTIKGANIDVPAFTRLDQDLVAALLAADYADGEPVCAFVGLSFAQAADDVLRARQLIEKKLVDDFGLAAAEARRKAPSIVAKIETHKGWENRRFILDVADGVMVARGDLGLQVDVERVPDIQKRLIQLCNKRGKPVITATQMLSSMTRSIEPTRAEVSDVFNAIQDGTDAVMLSEETAIGRFAFHAITKMISIAIRAEAYYELQGVPEKALRVELRRRRTLDFLKDDHARLAADRERLQDSLDYVSKGWGLLSGDRDRQIERLEWRRGFYLEKRTNAALQGLTNRITEAAVTLTEATGVSAIVAATTSGRTVRMISRLRSRVPIVGAAHDAIIARRLTISYGVVPLYIGDVTSARGDDGLFTRCTESIFEHPYLQRLLAHKPVIFAGGFPLQQPGTTNMLQIRKVSREGGGESL